ncbi:MAG: hypothetical protein IJZ50_06560 [Alistipes sp.]|nr:hypothetical protein [Alistipes sp.]
MKKIFTLLASALCLVGVGSASAQSLTSYFMEGTYFRTQLNPALTTTRGYFNIPAVSGTGINVVNNFLSVDNFIYQRDGQLVTALHKSVSSDEFLGRLPDVNRLNANINTNILSVAFYTKKIYWNLGVNARVDTNVNLSKDIFAVLKTLGNGTYDLIDTSIDANAYLETYFGTSFRVCDWINVGLRVKFLVGLVNAHTDIDKMRAVVSPDGVTAELQGVVRGNAIFVDQSRVKPGEAIDGEFFNFSSVNYMLNNVKSYGFAADLGAEFRLLNDHLKLSAAITDLGVIKWSPKTHIVAEAKGAFGFNGYNVSADELEMTSEFEFVQGAKQTKGYSTMLTYSVNLGAEYNILRNKIAFGLLAHSKFNNGYLYTELTASVNFRPLNWLTATVSHTFLNRQKPGVFGAALNFHPKGINLFVGLDYIGTKWVMWDDTIKIPYDMKSLNLYAGVGFNFGRPKYMRAEQIAKREARKQARKEARKNR